MVDDRAVDALMQNRGWSPVGWGVLPRARPSSAPATPDAANLRGYMEGDNLDGANNSTLINGLPVASVVNLGTLGGTFDQLAALNMPLFSTTAGPGGTKPALTFDGSDWLVSSLAASSWAFLHDGTGATIYSVVRTNASAVGNIVATGTGSGIVRGILHRYNAAFAPLFFMSDGAVAQLFLTGGAVTTGQFSLLTSTFATADTPDGSLFVNGVSVATGNAGGVSALAPAATLTLGATIAGANGLVGSMRRIMIYAGAHSAAQQAAVLAYMQALDAVTYPAP